MNDLSKLTASQLLSLHADTMEELRTRGVVRSSNNPTGDLAEFLFCRAFGWKQAEKSARSVDAIGTDGARYQIKGRRRTRYSQVRQLSAIRDLNDAPFNFLAAVLFEEDYAVRRAVIISCEWVVEKAAFVERTNSHRFFLRDDVWDYVGARDVTSDLRSVDF